MPMSRNALSNEQFRELTSQVVHGIPTDLSVEDYDYLTTHGKERDAAIAETLRSLRTQNSQSQPAPKLLQSVTTISLPAISSFDVGAHIVATPDKERKSAEVLIGWIGDNAKRLAKGFVEPEVAEATLRVHRLTKASVDGPIIAELGGEEVVLTTWGQMYEMIRQQGRGQQGFLLTNGYANVFYVRQANGEVWAVSCCWYASFGYWSVYANPITDPSTWSAGRQFLSR
jgi:hypothetical protein